MTFIIAAFFLWLQHYNTAWLTPISQISSWTSKQLTSAPWLFIESQLLFKATESPCIKMVVLSPNNNHNCVFY